MEWGASTRVFIWNPAVCDIINNFTEPFAIWFSKLLLKLRQIWVHYKLNQSHGVQMSLSIQAEEIFRLRKGPPTSTRIHETTNVKYIQYLLTSVLFDHSCHLALWLYQCTVFDRYINGSATVCMHYALWDKMDGANEWKPAFIWVPRCSECECWLAADLLFFFHLLLTFWLRKLGAD